MYLTCNIWYEDYYDRSLCDDVRADAIATDLKQALQIVADRSLGTDECKSDADR